MTIFLMVVALLVMVSWIIVIMGGRLLPYLAL